MPTYILEPENYSHFVHVEKIKTVDEALFKIKIEGSGTQDDELFLDFKQKFEELIKETEVLSVYAESMEKGDPEPSNEIKDSDAYLLTSSRHFLKIVELSNEAKQLGIDVNESLIFRFLLYSAIGFFACRRHAISAALSNRLIEDIESINDDDTIIKDLFCLVIHFIGGKFIECQDLSKKLISSVRSKLETQSDDENWYYLPFIGVIAKRISFVVDSLIKGDLNDIPEHNAEIREIAIKLNELGFTEISLIFLKLSFSIGYLVRYSVWNLREVMPYNTHRQKSEVNCFIEARIEEKKYFIFHSQYEALFERRILDKSSNQLISMPTGAGKTLLGQLLVFKNLLLDEKHGSKIIYVVPTRSLAQEKLNEFEEIFSVEGLNYSICKITGDALIESEDVIKTHDILIMTQEKFDMLLRENFYGESINSVVADEFHNIYKDYRGLKLLLSLERFKNNQQYSGSRIFLISAILSQDNQEEIEKWLYPEGSTEGISFNTDWQPTFSRRGFFDYIKYHSNSMWPIEFDDGRTLRLEKPEIEVDPDLFFEPAAYIATELAKDDCVYLYSHKKADIIDDAKIIAKKLAKKEYNYIDWDKNRQYSQKLRRILRTHPFCDVFESGVAIHYGKLPLVIRKIVEESVKDKATPIIFATSTLAQGLNLPIKSILIPYPKLGKETMDIGSFLNLIGRAGRPYQAEEGQVVLMTYKGKPGLKAFKREEIQKYLESSSKDISVAKNPIEVLIDKKSRNVMDTAYKIILGTLESLLLAGIAEGTVDWLENNKRLIEILSFGTRSIDYHKEVSTLLSEIQSRFLQEYRIVEIRSETLVLNRRGVIFYKSGFTPSSSLEQINWLSSNMALIRELVYIDFNVFDRRFGELWKRLLYNLLSTVEGKTYLDSDRVKEKWVWGSLSWIKEDPIETIAEKGYRNDLLTAYSELEGSLSGFISWGLFAVGKWMSLLNIPNNEVIEKKFIDLSKYVWYGANDPIALQIMTDDTNRRLLRDDVIRIEKAIKSRMVKNFVREPSLLHEEAVIDSLNKIDLFKYENSEIISILKKMYGS